MTHRVLVVEDDPGTLYVLSAIFTRMGWSVQTAHTVAEALRCLAGGLPPCLLILDLDLPDGTGLAVLQDVRARGLPTYVAVCSGTVDGDLLADVAALRPDALLTKPASFGDVWQGVCRVCGGLDIAPAAAW